MNAALAVGLAAIIVVAGLVGSTMLVNSLNLRRAVRMGGALAGCCTALSACGGSGRSTAAFCSTMLSQQKQILAQMNRTANANSGNGLAHAFDELGASVEGVSALSSYFDALAQVAPPAIEDDANTVAQSYKQELSDASDAASNPLGALGGALMTSMSSSYQMNAMNDFALKHCGHSI